MIGFPLQLPIEATTKRAFRVAEDATLPSLEMIEGPVLVVPLSDAEAPAIRAWIERGGPRKPTVTPRQVTPVDRLAVDLVMAIKAEQAARDPGTGFAYDPAHMGAIAGAYVAARIKGDYNEARTAARQLALMAMQLALSADSELAALKPTPEPAERV